MGSEEGAHHDTFVSRSPIVGIPSFFRSVAILDSAPQLHAAMIMSQNPTEGFFSSWQ